MSEQQRRRPPAERRGSGSGPGERRPRAGSRRPPPGRPSGPRQSSRRPASTRAVLRMPLGDSTRRLQVLLVVLGIVASVCAGRLVQIQGLDASAYASEASKQLTRSAPIAATRGTITDRDGTVLAVTSPAVMITADPTLINNPEPDKNR
ncbi:MAG: hypothetical protein Q4F67_05305, partial [Propionibacteriaceae bacterium]|nr:hypothetical protein [Propionibacteriaceae bacterium]